MPPVPLKPLLSYRKWASLAAACLVIVFLGVRGEGAGSARDLARRTVAKLHK